jgi:hypothetical protein
MSPLIDHDTHRKRSQAGDSAYLMPPSPALPNLTHSLRMMPNENVSAASPAPQMPPIRGMFVSNHCAYCVVEGYQPHSGVYVIPKPSGTAHVSVIH